MRLPKTGNIEETETKPELKEIELLVESTTPEVMTIDEDGWDMVGSCKTDRKQRKYIQPNLALSDKGSSSDKSDNKNRPIHLKNQPTQKFENNSKNIAPELAVQNEELWPGLSAANANLLSNFQAQK